MQAIAPNIQDRFYLLRPTAVFSSPPHCTYAELKTIITLNELADLHEGINLQEATIARAEEEAEREAAQNRPRGRRGY